MARNFYQLHVVNYRRLLSALVCMKEAIVVLLVSVRSFIYLYIATD